MTGRHLHAGVYPVWGGITDAAEFSNYPWTKGAHLFFTWGHLQPTEDGPYRWDIIADRAATRLGNRTDKAAYLQVNFWPDWIYNHVAKAQFTERDRNPPQFWDPVYIDLYTTFIQDLAAHIAQSPYRDQIILVRAQYNAFNAEEIHVRQDSQALYTSYTPTPSGHRYEVNLTQAIGNAYARQITQAYVDAFAPLGILAVQKPFGYWWEDEELADEWAAMGAGFFMTNEGPSPPNRDKIIELVKEKQLTRALSEPVNWSGADIYDGIPNAQIIYWNTLGTLHQGMEFITYYGIDLQNAALDEIFAFANRYAGWYREPGRAPGAWIALRDMEMDTTGWWIPRGNYEYLMREIAPEGSRGLFAYTKAEKSLFNPADEPTTAMPSSAKESIWAKRTDGRPIYLDLDDTFVASLTSPIQVYVTYLDTGSDLAGIAFNDASGTRQTFTWQKTNSGTWKTHLIETNNYQFANNLDGGADILLGHVGSGNDIYHMVEIVRLNESEESEIMSIIDDLATVEQILRDKAVELLAQADAVAAAIVALEEIDDTLDAAADAVKAD